MNKFLLFIVFLFFLINYFVFYNKKQDVTIKNKEIITAPEELNVIKEETKIPFKEESQVIMQPLLPHRIGQNPPPEQSQKPLLPHRIGQNIQ